MHRKWTRRAWVATLAALVGASCARRREPVSIGGDSDLSRRAYEVARGVVSERSIPITEDADRMLRAFFDRAEYRRSGLDEQRVVESARGIGDRLTRATTFDSGSGRQAVTAQSVSTVTTALCPPPIYPIC